MKKLIAVPLAVAVLVAATVPLEAQEGKRHDARITVGANVQISAAHGNRPHNEEH